jgi:putative lipoprotein
MLRGIAVTIGWVALTAGCAGEEKKQSPAPAIDLDDNDLSADAAIEPGNVGYIDGSITYLQRIAIPKGSTVLVELFDISGGGTRATRISRQHFATDSQVPIRFQVAYDRTRIDPARSYGLRAQILVDDALWFVNDQPVPVLTRGNSTGVQIPVRPAAAMN